MSFWQVENSAKCGTGPTPTPTTLSVNELRCCEVDGKNVAARRHCKFIEVSALLDHRMDELLVGITRQIRLRKAQPSTVVQRGLDAQRRLSRADGDAPVGCLQRAAVAAFRKLFRRRGPVETTSCDDLFIP